MKKFLLTFAIALLTALCAWAAAGDTFTYQDGSGYNLKYSVNEGDTTVTCTGMVTQSDAGAADLVIPESVSDGGTTYTVTSIGEKAFYYCVGFTGTLTIGDGVTSIGSKAFEGCKFTGSLTIPDGVTSIGESAFNGCIGFTGSLTIGNGVTSIGDYAFNICSGFTGILTIGDDVTSIGSYAFKECSGFTGSLTIPNSVTTIGNYAFYNCKAFTGSLTIGNSVTSIGDVAFANCSGLLSVVMLSNTPPTIVNGNAFLSVTATLTVPNGCTAYGSVNSPWQGMTIVASVGDTFTYQDGMGYNLSYTVNADGTTVTCTGMVNKSDAGAADLVIPESVSYNEVDYTVTAIGDEAFYECTGFTGSLTIGNGVTTIGDYAFSDCSGFTGTLTIGNGVTSIGEWAFADCGFDGTLTIPNSVTSIGESAFYYCSGFDGTLTIPNSVTSIGNGAFIYCSGFDGSLTIPNSVTSIGNETFANCYNLTGFLTIPQGVTSIGEWAFSECRDLKSLIIPSSVTTIEHSAFLNCSGLRRIINNSTEPQDLDNYEEESDETYAFDGIEMDLVTLCVPKASIEAYKAAAVWKEFNIEAAPTVKPIENITIDLDSAFNQIDLLDYFTINGDYEIGFIVQSDNPEVVSVTMNGNKFGVIPISVGKTNIKIVAKSEYGIESQVDFTVTVTDEKGTSSGCVSFTVIEDIIPVKCPGDETGSISLQVSGNTAPYKFRWSNTQTGNEINELIAGEYTVVIRDSLGCAETKTYEVEGPDFISIKQTLTKPDCGQNNGSIEVNVKGGTAPYSYDWGNTEKSPTISDLPSGVYALTVKDSRKCEYKKTIILDSKVSIEITVDSSKNTKCSSSEKGEIHVSVSGGTAPYSYNWADGGVGYNRTNLDEGIYNLVVTDDKGCTANLSHEIQSTSFLTPAIGLVSVDRETNNNLIIWQKEETNEIDFYNIYRENPQTKEFEIVGTWDYDKISVYEDTDVDPNESSWRYRLQAENDCGDRSKLSKSFKTIHMKSVELTEEGVALTWDDYEGEVYPTYAIHRVFGSKAVLEARVPFHTSYYFDANPPKDVTSYFVAVELPEDFVVEGNILKAESGPFTLAVSNIAEVEINAGGGNDDETSLNSVLNQISVYPTVAKDVITVTVGAGQQAQVMLYTLTGEKVYEQEVLETAELNVSSMPKGVYTVVVTIEGVGYGYKVIVNY